MATPKELLAKIDAEILTEVNKLVAECDAPIKEIAQAAYDAAVEAEIAKIKAAVEIKYETARQYLTELLPEEPAEEAEVEEVKEEEAKPEEVIEEAQEPAPEVQ